MILITFPDPVRAMITTSEPIKLLKQNLNQVVIFRNNVPDNEIGRLFL